VRAVRASDLSRERRGARQCGANSTCVAYASVFSRGLRGIVRLLSIATADFGWVCSHSPFRDLECIDIEPLPSGQFVARLMQLSMMAVAKEHRELIADRLAERSQLSKA
jgi:hypothetical protein